MSFSCNASSVLTMILFLLFISSGSWIHPIPLRRLLASPVLAVRLHRLRRLLRRHNPLSSPSSKPGLSRLPSSSWLPRASAESGLISSPFLSSLNSGPPACPRSLFGGSRVWSYPLSPHSSPFLPSFPVRGIPSVVPVPLATS